MILQDPIEADALPPQLMHDARQQALASGRPLMDVLEECAGMPVRGFILALGRTLHYPVLDMHALYALQPAFDVLPFTEAVQKNCFMAREQGALVAVLANPFDVAFQSWLEARCDEAIDWRIAHRSDLSAFFAVHEDALRAIDSAIHADDGTQAHKAALTDLSLASIAEDSNRGQTRVSRKCQRLKCAPRARRPIHPS